MRVGPRALRPVPCAHRSGVSGTGVRGRAARRVQPELPPGATQQGPTASSRHAPPSWHLPAPRPCNRGHGPWPPRPASLVLVFLSPAAPFRFPFFFFFFCWRRDGEKRCSPNAPRSRHTHDCCRHPLRLSLACHQPADPELQLPTTLVADLILFYILSQFSFATPQTRGPSSSGDQGTHRGGEGVRKEGWEGRKLCSVENYFCLY